MRPHKIEPYRSVLEAMVGDGCPLCRYMRNDQLKVVQGRLTPLPTGICNYHAWAIAATHDRLNASRVFLNLLSAHSLGGEMVCDICVRLDSETEVQVEILNSALKTASIQQRAKLYGSLCIPHGQQLRKSASANFAPLFEKTAARHRDELMDDLKAQQRVDVDGSGWGVLGRVAEFLTGQRGLYR